MPCRASSRRNRRRHPPATPFSAYEDKETGLYKMEVSSSTLMVVVVDQTNEVYAYSKQEVDLDGEPVTPAGGLPSVACDVDLRRGRLALVVDASRAPETKPQTQSDADEHSATYA